MSVAACRSSSFSSCSAFSSNPTQRNLRMSLIISLDAAGVLFGRRFHDRPLVYSCFLIFEPWCRSLQHLRRAAFVSDNRSGVDFYLNNFAAMQWECGATCEGVPHIALHRRTTGPPNLHICIGTPRMAGRQIDIAGR